ncbi:hypothetical protein F2Q69_00027150 [Brassica cretica]|uniref:Transmembrane protein n=1 Tax=Brassica cretica TaxID=69181 RepID=A0A8S9S323_BRACR|nr:hypothetical protein F2Q69_00027150 [Brassica cretica]
MLLRSYRWSPMLIWCGGVVVVGLCGGVSYCLEFVVSFVCVCVIKAFGIIVVLDKKLVSFRIRSMMKMESGLGNRIEFKSISKERYEDGSMGFYPRRDMKMVQWDFILALENGGP